MSDGISSEPQYALFQDLEEGELETLEHEISAKDLEEPCEEGQLEILEDEISAKDGIGMPSKPDDNNDDNPANWREINVTIERFPPHLSEDNVSKVETDSVKLDSHAPASTKESSADRINLRDDTSVPENNVDLPFVDEEPKLLTEIERREAERNRKGCLKKKGKSRIITGPRYVPKEHESIDQPFEDEPEFVWEDYLEETGCIAAPPTAFIHVEKSLENGFKESMMLEILHDKEQGLYWFGKIILTCGPLLSLRYLGNEAKPDEDFWCDVNTQEVHPLGWCKERSQKIMPPSGITEVCVNWEEELLPKSSSFESPSNFVFENGMTPIDQIKQGILLEIQDEEQPNHVWLVNVIQNVGGRLLLHYEGCKDSSFDFWLFYLSWRLHALDWAKDNGFKYLPPKCVPSQQMVTESAHKLLSSCDEAVHFHSREKNLSNVFLNQEELPNHEFEIGMKLEILSPVDHLHFVPATVTSVPSGKVFLLELDDFSESAKKLYFRHSASWDIFPPGWAKENNIKIQIPKGYTVPSVYNMPVTLPKVFDWEEYFKNTGAEPAPKSIFKKKPHEKMESFEKGMRLESVNPFQPHQLCAAAITKIVSHLIWIQLDGVDAFNVHHHITSITSHEIFPVGWCEGNNYPLTPPRRWLSKRQRKILAKKSNQEADSSSIMDPMLMSHFKDDICPKIYINHRCFSGRFLSKGKIAELPRYVGPGPVQLVIKEVLNLLIGAAYIATRVHKELQLDGKPDPSMKQVMMKAKYKGKSRRGIIEIPYRAEQVDIFCKSTCKKMVCCPYLISLVHISDKCPESCHRLTKTQYTAIGSFSRKPKRLWNPSKRKNLLKKDSSDYESEKSIDSDDPPKKRLLLKQSLFPDEDNPHQSNNFMKGPSLYRGTTAQAIKDPECFSSSPPVDYLLPKIIDIPKLATNPLHWSVRDVAEYFKNSDCVDLIPKLREQEIDGLAVLLLGLPAVRDCFRMKLGPAIKFCKHIEKLRMAFFLQYCK